MFIPSQTEGKWWGKPFPPFGQFLEHLHHWSFARCLCKSTSHGCKNDFMINAQRILKAIWSFVYYLERRKKGWWSRSTIQSNKMLKSFKSTSLSLAWRPKAKLLRETWSAGYWRAHFSSFLAILPLFCSRVRSKCSSSSSACFSWASRSLTRASRLSTRATSSSSRSCSRRFWASVFCQSAGGGRPVTTRQGREHSEPALPFPPNPVSKNLSKPR